MHPTAWHNCNHFFDAYAGAFQDPGTKVIEIGSQDVNYSPMPEDRRKLICIKHIVDNTMKV